MRTDAMRRGVVGLYAAGALAVTMLSGGCAGGGPGSPAASPSEPVPVSAPPPSSAPVDTVLVEYGRQGGFAGFVDRLVVSRDGGYQLTRAKPPVSRHGQLTPTELADLRQKLDGADLGHQPRAQASTRGNDLYTYQVSAGGRQVVAQDGSVTPSLQPLLALLSGLVAKYGAQS